MRQIRFGTLVATMVFFIVAAMPVNTPPSHPPVKYVNVGVDTSKASQSDAVAAMKKASPIAEWAFYKTHQRVEWKRLGDDTTAIALAQAASMAAIYRAETSGITSEEGLLKVIDASLRLYKAMLQIQAADLLERAKELKQSK